MPFASWGVPVGPYRGQAAHSLVPAGGRDVYLGSSVQEDSLGEVMPGASKPYGGLGGVAGRCNGAVAEHISPLNIGAVRRSHDKSARVTGDEQCAVLAVEVATVVYKVDGAFHKRVLHIGAVGRLACGNPCILIREQSHIVEDYTVTGGIERKSLRPGLLLVSVGVLKSDVLEETVVGIHPHGSAHADMYGVLATAKAVIEDYCLFAVLTDDVHEWL